MAEKTNPVKKMSKMGETNYILKLAGWYPSRVDEYNGDFIQRHAASISLYEKVIVLFLVKDQTLRGGHSEVRRSERGNLVEYIVYYGAGGPLEKMRSLVRYLLLGLKMVRQIRKEHGAPALMHVSVVWKAGLLALLLKKKYGWKYIVTEHWSGYMEKDPEGLHTQGALVQWLYKMVYQSADLIVPVSAEIGRQILRWFPGLPMEVVYNVVDTDLFNYNQTPSEIELPASGVWRLIHVSSMGHHPKNIEGILRVLQRLTAERDDVEITLVGPYPPAVRQTLADSGLLDRKVLLTGEVSYAEVARFLHGAHLLFLFSRYENQPCVLLEALCCGLPVIATWVGGIPEIVDDSNGILVGSEQEDQLLQAFVNALDHYSQYDRPAIAAAATQKFSYAVIGEQFARIYRRYLSQP
ncbi:MAG TPA: glycosyltransferase [Puia sp.]|jgi:glycosyltransferase involved in cell wall biosynthesis|nr:glycosyltransferase [Puia sp.]